MLVQSIQTVKTKETAERNIQKVVNILVDKN